jgi:Rrf2 family transcriptional regulator, iron-sulfur cluster assembly transcription factor
MRLEITHRADLAVRAMQLLGAGSTRWKSSDLAAALDTTSGFVPQVMGPLVRAGWVRSVPGPTGGYEATTAADDISVLDVVEAIDGPTDDGRCVVADRPCDSTRPCVLHTAWGRARRQLQATLAAQPLTGAAT